MVPFTVYDNADAAADYVSVATDVDVAAAAADDGEYASAVAVATLVGDNVILNRFCL